MIFAIFTIKASAITFCEAKRRSKEMKFFRSQPNLQKGFSSLASRFHRLWRGFTLLDIRRESILSMNYIREMRRLYMLVANDSKLRRGLKPQLNFLAGFTLVELMIVVAVIAILASVGGIALNSQMPKYRLRGDARTIVSSLMVARMKATSTGLQYAIEFDLDASPQEYRLQRGGGSWNNESYRRQLSTGINIAQVQDDTAIHTSGIARIIFYPNGSSGVGDIRLRQGNLSDGYQILLTRTTGRIQTIKGWP